MDDPTLDPRLAGQLDVITDHVYARLLMFARERGLGLYITGLENLPYPNIEKQFRTNCAQILVDLLDAAGLYTLPKAA